jgi:hypothetical protein
MRTKKLFSFVSVLVLLGMLLTACGAPQHNQRMVMKKKSPSPVWCSRTTSS